MLRLSTSSSYSSHPRSSLTREMFYSQNYFSQRNIQNHNPLFLLYGSHQHGWESFHLLWTLITILIITGSETFPKWDFKGETFKLCGENHQQHGLMSRLYIKARLTFASLLIGYDETRAGTPDSCSKLRHLTFDIETIETFKLCGENHQQHGLMSRLYIKAKLKFASLLIGYDETS